MSDARSGERITVYSDYVCPFCYLGRQSLAQYQASRDAKLEIDWHPFDLRAGKRGPDGEIDDEVDDGTDDDYFERARRNVERLAAQYDAEMDVEIATDVDSLDAQVASYRVAERRPYEEWLEFDVAIFEALWRDGRDVGDGDVLADIAADVGLDPDEIRDAVADDEAREAVEEQFEAARRRGVTGVPTFAYDGRTARGAVPPEQLERLVDGV